MPLSQALLNSFSNVSFQNSDDIDNWFVQHTNQDFVSWFNAHVANRLFWGKSGARAGISIMNDSQGHERFDQLWSNATINSMFNIGSISMIQFLALQSIVNNETGGQLLPLTEKVGAAGHPGIAYAFDRILNLKKAYNTLPGNKTCLALFNDKNYNKAFDTLSLASQLKNTQNAVWGGEAYPQSISTSTNPLQSGYVLEADFFKFRGRGFIQTTGRSNYIKLVEYVMDYKGSNNTVLVVKQKWSNLSTDTDIIATVSTNADWDNLFQKGDCLVAGKAINMHNNSGGNYLEKLKATTTTTVLNALLNMGKRISGSDAYALLFQNRVKQILDSL